MELTSMPVGFRQSLFGLAGRRRRTIEMGSHVGSECP
jgi:hypothetical protein